jgi:hypothetical protein
MIDAGMAGIGTIDTPSSSARVDISLPSELDGQVLLTNRLLRARTLDSFAGPGPEHDLLERALAVARDIASGRRVPTMGPVLSGPVDHALPEGYDVPVIVTLSVLALTGQPGPTPPITLSVPLPLRDAVRPDREARGSVEGHVAGVRVRASATLGAMDEIAPEPGTKPPAEPWRRVQLALAVHLEDSRGSVVDRRYVVRGNVFVDGLAAATWGFTIPEMDRDSGKALVVRLPGNDNALAIELRLDPDIRPDR